MAKHMQLGPGQLRASIERLRFNTLAMRITDFSTAVRATVEPPKDIVTLGFVLRADEPFLIAGRHFRVDMMSVFGAGQVSEVRYPAGSRSVTLAMPFAVYARELAGAPMRDALDSADANPRVQVTGPDVARLRDIISTMEALAARDPALWLDGQWTANAERALLEAFFLPLGDPALVKVGSADRSRAARTIVREVEARLDADPMSLPSMPALCAALRNLSAYARAGVSRSARRQPGASPAPAIAERRPRGPAPLRAGTRHRHPHRHRQWLLASRPLLPVLSRPVRRTADRYASPNGSGASRSAPFLENLPLGARPLQWRVIHRLRPSGFPMRTARYSGRSGERSPGSRTRSFRACRGLRPRGVQNECSH